MSAHAYLIMAFSEYEQLKMLIEMLDYPENDIYVHIDKRSPAVSDDYFRESVKYSSVKVFQKFPIYWGHYSQTACELFLLEIATKKKYQYIHLLSGADLPLCTQGVIHSFFSENNGKEYVRYWGPEFPESVSSWIRFYHPLQRYLRVSSIPTINHAFEVVEKCFEKIQEFIGVNRLKKKNIEFQKGATWFSITGGFAEYVVSQKEWIRKNFINTRSSDEIFLQTVLHNSEFEKNRFEKTYEIDGLSGIRYIDWKRGKPYVFKTGDFEELIHSGFLFARKFSINSDRTIVEQIYQKILLEQRKELSVENC